MKAKREGNEVIWIDAPGHAEPLEIEVAPVAFGTWAKVITLLFVLGGGVGIWWGVIRLVLWRWGLL